MGTQVAAILRVSSVIDTAFGRGKTDKAIRDALAVVRLPEGPFGPLRMFLQNAQSHSHDSNWGHLTLTGDLPDHHNGQDVIDWWQETNLILAEATYLNAVQGVLHLMVDGERPVMLDHMGGLRLGMEMTGDYTTTDSERTD